MSGLGIDLNLYRLSCQEVELSPVKGILVVESYTLENGFLGSSPKDL